MKKIIFGLMAFAFFATASYHARADEARTDCKATMTRLVEMNPTATVSPLDATESAHVLEENGAPPVAPPFSFAIATDSKQGMLIIHDKDCILQVVGPAPKEVVLKFIGRTDG